MKKQQKFIIGVAAIVAILIGAFLVYSSSTKTDDDDFPQLTYGGATFKGYFADLGGYWQYESGDNCVHSTSLSTTTLSSGQNYYYTTEDLTIQEIVDRINCVPQNRIRILYKDPISQDFYSWPEAVHNETETLNDSNNLTVLANTAFIIQSKDETLMGEIYNVNEPLPPAPVMSPAVNPFKTGGPYEFVNDMTSGWVGVIGTTDGAQMSADLNSSDIANRVENVFSKNGADMNAFQEVTITSGTVADIDFSDGEHMIWMKLGVELPVIVIGDPDVCGEETDAYQCITTGVFPVQFIESGTDACASIGKVCAAVQQQFEGGEWQPYNGDICDQGYASLTDTLRWRAVCAEESELDDPAVLCDPNDLDHACITETERTGTDACTAIGRVCNDDRIDYNTFGTPETWVNQPFTDCSVDYDSLASDSIWRAGCDFYIAPLYIEVQPIIFTQDSPCDSVPNGYTCITDEGGLPQFETGEELCQSIGPDEHCRALSYYNDTTETWNEMDDACSTWGWRLGDVYDDPYAVQCQDNLLACGGNDDYHSCMTSNAYNQYFRWTGDEACSFIGKSCVQVEKFWSSNWVPNTSGYDCSDSWDIMYTDQTLRAVCE